MERRLAVLSACRSTPPSSEPALLLYPFQTRLVLQARLYCPCNHPLTPYHTTRYYKEASATQSNQTEPTTNHFTTDNVPNTCSLLENPLQETPPNLTA